MSWLSSITTPLWRKLKGGRTDVQTVAAILVERLSDKQKAQLRQDLFAVQQTVAIAQLAQPTSTQVATAKIWVDGALESLR